MNNISDEVFNIIFKNAKVSYAESDEPFSEFKKLLRYHCSDIPSAPRYLFDSDAVYFYNFDEKVSAVGSKRERRFMAERGDVMTTLWTPLTYFLGMNRTGRISGKSTRSVALIIENLRSESAFLLFDYFSRNYATRGNSLLLPDSKNSLGKRNLNPDKFMTSEDKIDQFLYFCLNGELLEYFENSSSNLSEWILSEGLECMFSPDFFGYPLKDIEGGRVVVDKDENKIRKENLQSLAGDKSLISTYKYRDFSATDWKGYFERLNKVIAYRNSVGINPHLPLKWDIH